ncbi:uncharacterized protein TNCV_2698541 [Trichonephila clavipes]|nr:uncharacterized protein TNCV_2698541 [Trichonephila clavipes]
MVCAPWEKKVGAGTTKVLHQVKNIPTNIPSQKQLFFKLKFFRDICKREVLLKCLHGRTQNPNESFNNCVRNNVPKNTFVCKRTLQIGVMDAVMSLNEDTYARTEVLKSLKINPGINTCEDPRKTSKRPGQQKGKLKGSRML